MNDAFLDDDVFFSDERSYCVVVQNVLRESAASRRRSVAHRRQVTVKSVPPVNFQMFRQMIGPRKTFLTNGTSEKNDKEQNYQQFKDLLGILVGFFYEKYQAHILTQTYLTFFGKTFKTTTNSECVTSLN